MNRNFAAAALIATLLMLTGAAHAQTKPDADKPKPPDPKVLQTIFDAIAGGLPEKWDTAWVEVKLFRQARGSRDFEVACMASAPGGAAAGEPVSPCDRKTVFENVYGLNRNISERDQQRWTSAKLVFMRDGKFELTYGYEPLAAPQALSQARHGRPPASQYGCSTFILS